MDTTRKTGTVVRILRDKYYGFIKVEGEKDIFFHANALDGCTLDDLHDGYDGSEIRATIVTFLPGQNRQGKPQAEAVRIVGIETGNQPEA